MEHIPSLITWQKKKPLLNPAYDWVLSGHGTATVQYDGKAYAVFDGQPYTHCISSTLTNGMLVSEMREQKIWGWVPVPEEDVVFWRMWREEYDGYNFDNWTYEVVGPSIGRNPENSLTHVMIHHGRLEIRPLKQPTLEMIKDYLASHDIEGAVWWEDMDDINCRKVKVQQSDFGFTRKKK